MTKIYVAKRCLKIESVGALVTRTDKLFSQFCVLSERLCRAYCITLDYEAIIYKRLVDGERRGEENELFLCNTLYKLLWVMLSSLRLE